MTSSAGSASAAPHPGRQAAGDGHSDAGEGHAHAHAAARDEHGDPRDGAGDAGAAARDAGSVEEALALVRAAGGRVTPARRLLLAALFADREHRTAEELAAEVQTKAPDVALSTIYRNLEELERLGVIDRTPLGRGPAAYHLASAGPVHGHFVCDECGRMIQVPVSVFADLSEVAASRYGFTVDPHRFAVVGRCADCGGGGA